MSQRPEMRGIEIPLISMVAIFKLFKIMIWNPYSQLIPLHSGNRALFNYVNDSAIILNRELMKILMPLLCEENISQIKLKHPQLYQHLCDNDFIIDQQNPTDWVIEILKKKLRSDKIFRLTINPTLDCNLRCWYCYQTHTKNCYMEPGTKDAVIRFAESKIASDKLETFRLSFFGGEPLLRASKIALPIAREIASLCRIHNKKFQLHFTTNGVLLSSYLLKQIKAICPETSFQIPFDGGRHLHNQTKKDLRGVGSYDITLKNLKTAVSLGLRANVRCNYTIENIDSFADLISDIRSSTSGKEHLINISLQRVWQEKPTQELINKCDRIATLIKSGGNNCSVQGKSIPLSFCYADYESSIVINYDGSLYKCTARDFTPPHRIGILLPNGDIDLWTDKYSVGKRYLEVCKSCSILPICTICVQARCEHSSNQCPVMISEEDKKRQISNRFFAIHGESI